MFIKSILVVLNILIEPIGDALNMIDQPLVELPVQLSMIRSQNPLEQIWKTLAEEAHCFQENIIMVQIIVKKQLTY